MGNTLSCCGSSLKSKEDRAKGWKATGIVGIRDQGLKVFINSLSSFEFDSRYPRFGFVMICFINLKSVKVLKYFGKIFHFRKKGSYYNASLQDIPAAIEDLKDRATTLDVTHNKIGSLPDFLLQFSRIQRLMMAKNSLTELPSQFGVLSTLKVC